MDHHNQRVRSGRTNTASKLFNVNFIFQNMVQPFHHDGFKNLWNNWGKWNWSNIFFDRPWRLFFWSGITCAVFHKAGITPSRSEVLKSAVKGAASVLALSLRTHAGTLSGPTALFTLICCKAFSVVITLMTYSAGISSWTSNTARSLVSRGRLLLTDTKNSFIRFASTSILPSHRLFARPCISASLFDVVPIRDFICLHHSRVDDSQG